MPNKITLAAAAALAFGAVQSASPAARAGDPTPVDSKEAKTVTSPTLENPWHFELASPSWIAATAGTIGLNGSNTHVYTSFDTLLRHLNMTGALDAEVRYNRFGFYGDFLYVNASQTTTSDGLIRKTSGGLAQWVADMELKYRVLESEQGWVDIRAGTRYTNMFTGVNIYPNDGAIDRASAQLVQALASNLKGTLQKDLHNVLDGQNPSLAIPPLGEAQKQKLITAIQTLRQDPELAAAVQAQAAATTAALKAAAQPRIDAALKRVENNIASSLKKNLNRSLSLSEEWWDPYVGFGGHYNINKTYYLVGKADIGGFSIGSQITWQVYGGVGCNLSKNIFAEVGYRYMYTNYRSGGFVSETSQSGAQVIAGIKF